MKPGKSNNLFKFVDDKKRINDEPLRTRSKVQNSGRELNGINMSNPSEPSVGSP